MHLNDYFDALLEHLIMVYYSTTIHHHSYMLLLMLIGQDIEMIMFPFRLCSLSWP